MRNIQMAKGAHTVVNRCAKVKPGETVLIVTEPSRMSIAEELGAAVCAAGGEPVFCSILPRERDGQEPPAPVAAAMKAADVFLCVVGKSITHTQAVKEAVAQGARGLVVLFNMAVTLVGILLAVYLNICQKRERAAQVQ